MSSRTPADFIGTGAAAILVGVSLCLLVAGVTQTPEVLWAAVLPGLVGGVIMQIGVVAWGVSVGIRHANEQRLSQSVGAQR